MKRCWVFLLLAAVLSVSGTLRTACGQGDLIWRPGIGFPAPSPIDHTVWRGELGSSGDWFDAALWTEGVPTAENLAYLVNGSETRFDSGIATAGSLILTWASAGQARMTQVGGQLNLSGLLAIQDGVYRQLGGRIEALNLQVGIGPVTFFQPDTTGVPLSLPLPVFFQPESQYELDGGEIASSQVHVGAGGLVVIRGGRLTTDAMVVDAARTGSILTNSFRINGVSQSGGEVTVAGELSLQDGAYTLSGGSLTVDTLAMGDPLDLNNSQRSSFGPRKPEFIQRGGELIIMENLELCVPGFIFNPDPIEIPIPTQPPFTDITYRLNAGTVSVAGDTVVGSMGVAPARFLQSGGTQHTAGTLRIEGEASRYEITGGQLHVGTLEVGVNAFNTGGTFAIDSGSATVVVEDRVTLGDEAVLEAIHGAAIQLAGGDFEIHGGDADLLAGMQDLSLIIHGGDQVSTLEVASVDVGDTAGGFENNFMLGTLQIGDGDEAGHLRLVDLFDNANATTPEALYVDQLIVSEGSTLDLGGLNLYYREAVMLGHVAASGGTMAVVIPESGTLVLMVAGLPILARRRHA